MLMNETIPLVVLSLTPLPFRNRIHSTTCTSHNSYRTLSPIPLAFDKKNGALPSVHFANSKGGMMRSGRMESDVQPPHKD